MLSIFYCFGRLNGLPSTLRNSQGSVFLIEGVGEYLLLWPHQTVWQIPHHAWCHDRRGASCGAIVWLEAEVGDAVTAVELREKGQGQWCATVKL